MKKTIKNLAPLALFMFIPYLNVNNVNAECSDLKAKKFVFEDRSLCMSETSEVGKMIVRNVIRK